MNLAGLHLHETLPYWLKTNVLDTQKAYVNYRKLLHDILQSDRIDYYTFFFQYWNLFPYSYTAKLQAVNTRLFFETMNVTKKPLKDVAMVYTSVLSRQSWLFNQFKYLGEVRDFISVNKSPHRNAGFEGAYRILMGFAKSNKTATAWFQLTGIREMPPADRLEKWLEVLLPPPVRAIHGQRIVKVKDEPVKRKKKSKVEELHYLDLVTPETD
jgi:hypothetical protein